MEVVTINLWTAWTMILAGMVSGAAQGLFFHADHWLGGYSSWRRRIMRLGHIAFFGLAFVNLAFVYTVQQTDLSRGVIVPSILLCAANVLMPTFCFASAWRKPLRHLLCVPASCAIAGIAGLLVCGVIQ